MGILIAILIANLVVLAGCSREFDNPYLPSSPDYAGNAWSVDDNGNGVADSVEKYAPGCGEGPATCLALAQARWRAAADPENPAPILIDSLSAPDLRLKPGESQVVQVEVLPANASSRIYELISGNDGIAAIRNGGVLGTGVGDAVISIRALDGSGKLGTFKVTVRSMGP